MEHVKTIEEVVCRCAKCMRVCIFPYDGTDDKYSLAPLSSKTLDIILNCTHVSKNDAVIFVGGFMDTLLCHMLVLATEYSQKNPNQDVWYTTYSSKKQLARIIKAYNAQNKKVILVGHSWGGDTAAHLLAEQQDIHVDLLITLDPVSKKGPPQKTPNMGTWLNEYVDYNISGITASNMVALIGGRWKNAANADVNITQQEWGAQAESLGNKALKDLDHADVYWMFFCDRLAPFWKEVLPESVFDLPAGAHSK